ncbi:MAG: DNA ligase D [Gemmatimonadaceae bacterium]|nr:DNA ligase D [Gemmatimonadaceae bacterium]
MATIPPVIAPMLTTWMERPPAGEFHYEIKLDGYRILAQLDGASSRMYSRNGKDYSDKLPEIIQALRRLRTKGTVLDGEIVVFDKHEVSQFGALQEALALGRSHDIRYVAFDLLFHAGRDLRELSIEERRERLTRLLSKNGSPLLLLSSWVDGDAQQLLKAAEKAGYEGLIGKRAGSAYVSVRSRDWIKLTFAQRQEGVIVGFTAPKGSRTGLGALLLAVRDGSEYRYIGKVGTGFSTVVLDQLARKLRELTADRMPLSAKPPDASQVQWVKPTIVVDVEHAGFTAAGRLRKPVFIGLRADRNSRDIVRREAAPPQSSASTRSTTEKDGAMIEGVRISNADRVIDTHSGATKGELAYYYAAVATWLLPHVAHRPVALMRAPDGVEGETFFQKHAAPRSIPGVRLLPKSLDPGHAPLLAIDSVQALVGTVQMGTVELHSWNAVESNIEKPDRMIFDLDPDPALPFSRVRQAATLVRELLETLGLISFVKTTGGAGLHVVVPLTRRAGWDDVKAFSRSVAIHAAMTLPSIFVAKSGPKNRVRRIFVDYLRNGRGASTAIAYSARARKGMPVSVPISWDELATLKNPKVFTIRSVPERLASIDDDPWAHYATTKQQITKAMRDQLNETHE